MNRVIIDAVKYFHDDNLLVPVYKTNEEHCNSRRRREKNVYITSITASYFQPPRSYVYCVLFDDKSELMIGYSFGSLFFVIKVKGFFFVPHVYTKQSKPSYTLSSQT